MQTLLMASENLYTNLIQKIQTIQSGQGTDLENSGKIIPLCLESLRFLRNLVENSRNLKPEEEIQIFKVLKPRSLSMYMLHVNIFRLHSHWPMGSELVQHRYIERELAQINQFFQDNHHFCCYYRAGSTFLDHLYFLRKQLYVEPSLELLYAEMDPQFNTSRDHMAAQVLAYNQFQAYLEKQLHRLLQRSSASSEDAPAKPILTWTESKSAAVELIYGLHARQVFNYGSVDLKTIATVFGAIFQVDLKNYADLFLHIKMRKIEPTKFVDSMQKSLHKKISDPD